MSLLTHDINEVEKRMRASLDALKREFSGLRTGRASANLLDPVQVMVAGGWERECDISLRAVLDSSGAALLAESSSGDSARVRLRGSTIVLRYLMDANNGGHWVNSWPIGPTVPIAIGVVSRSDTVVYRVGARG